MFVGWSEITISFIVEYAQYIGIIRSFYIPRRTIKFFIAWGTQEIAGLLFARGISTQGHTIDRGTGVFEAIVDAGMLTWADIDCSHH